MSPHDSDEEAGGQLPLPTLKHYRRQTEPGDADVERLRRRLFDAPRPRRARRLAVLGLGLSVAAAGVATVFVVAPSFFPPAPREWRGRPPDTSEEHPYGALAESETTLRVLARRGLKTEGLHAQAERIATAVKACRSVPVIELETDRFGRLVRVRAGCGAKAEGCPTPQWAPPASVIEEITRCLERALAGLVFEVEEAGRATGGFARVAFSAR